MRVLVVGAGGVGAAFASIAQHRPAFERVSLADVSPTRAHDVVAKLGEADRFSAERVDASDRAALVKLIERLRPDAVLNACDPRFNEPIFDAAFQRAHDLSGHGDDALPSPPPASPRAAGRDARRRAAGAHEQWEQAGVLALVGIGVEPGLSDVFARYAAEELFAKRRSSGGARRRRPGRRGL